MNYISWLSGKEVAGDEDNESKKKEIEDRIRDGNFWVVAEISEFGQHRRAKGDGDPPKKSSCIWPYSAPIFGGL